MTLRPAAAARRAGLALGLAALTMHAEPRAPNYEESAVPAYTLPALLVGADGTAVASADAWRARRRPELLELLAREVYGRTPGGRPAAMHWETTARDPAALGGRATRQEITVWFTAGRAGPAMTILLYRPNDVPGPVPVFLGLNFYGNHTTVSDPAVTLPTSWVPNYPADRVSDHRATAALRGYEAAQWQTEMLVARGYATATIYRGDLCPDDPAGLDGGVARLFAENSGAEVRADDAWGAVGVWAWGLSRALDVLATEPGLDAGRVAVHGHSRLGKAALWAGAQDERFALVVSNESGCGGAALSMRVYGETVGIINTKFPHWFARNFRRYNDRESDLPIDQHAVLALVAPRPLYVASADGDQWADPRGEFLSAQAAGAVYALLGRAGVGPGPLPPLATPVGDAVRYHLRPGPHDVTAYDWEQYLAFADRWLRAR